MTSLFDGVAGLLNDTFGGPVTYMPKGRSPRAMRSIFRELPVTLIDADGHPVRAKGPTWRVRLDLAPELARGDQISIPDGRIFEVQSVWPSGSPAADALAICDLFEVS